MKPRITGRRGLCALAVLIAIVLLAGCGGAGAGGSGDGDGDGGSGLDTIPAASDSQIYVPDIDTSLTLEAWLNVNNDHLVDLSETYWDTNGDGFMDIVVSGAPPTDWQYPAEDEFLMPSFVSYSDPSVKSYLIMEFDVVDSDGGSNAFVSLQGLGEIMTANPSSFTGDVHHYEFWWVASDLTITGSGDVAAFGNAAPMIAVPTIPFSVSLDLKAGWNIVRITDSYENADFSGGSYPLPVSETLVVAPISATARWIFEPEED